MDRITLKNLRARGRHGWESAERAALQTFDIDLELELDLRRAEESDDLADTVDYAALHRRIVELVERTSYALLEHLGAAVLAIVFEDRRVVRAVVTIAKPNILDGATPAVSLDRTNPTIDRA
jgi:FolB domain-containing protein